ncbi:hypothetical protein HMPREF3034_01345 [Prevotella sp. DNF00663]|nr:hypothetical protein HMPREF3034_01345 [Prevotella sp. DNF00663]
MMEMAYRSTWIAAEALQNCCWGFARLLAKLCSDAGKALQ